MTTQLLTETWHIAPQTIDDEIIILNDCDSVIATVPLWQDEDVGDKLEQQSRQNAVLITAAPKLLAAIEQAIQALNTPPRFRVPHLNTDSYKIASICDRALANAKGNVQ